MARTDRDALEDSEDNAAKPEKSASKSGMKKILLIVIGTLAVIGVSVGGTLLVGNMFGKHDDAPGKVAKKKAADSDADAANADASPDAAKDEQGGDGAGADGDQAADADTTADGTPRVAAYLDFDQPFVVNFQDDEGALRYLQITVSVMATDPKAIEAVKHHMPLIRNNLIMLFSGQSRATIISRDGKEKIRTDALAEVQKILKEQTGNPGIKSLYFTSFVMQ